MSASETNPMLATELLGFQPQLLLDELMSAVNETIYESTARVEEYLNQWIDEKEKAGENVEPLKRELEHVRLISMCDFRR
jgi:kinetochore protein Mis12/MTW1